MKTGSAASRNLARWRLRKLLALLPARDAATARAANPPRRIVYLFAGTYGDFVQAIPALRRLAAAYPGADLVLHGGHAYAREFSSEVPRKLRLAEAPEPWSWIFSRADLLFTNSVGVFRVPFRSPRAPVRPRRLRLPPRRGGAPGRLLAHLEARTRTRPASTRRT